MRTNGVKKFTGGIIWSASYISMRYTTVNPYPNMTYIGRPVTIVVGSVIVARIVQPKLRTNEQSKMTTTCRIIVGYIYFGFLHPVHHKTGQWRSVDLAPDSRIG